MKEGDNEPIILGRMRAFFHVPGPGMYANEKVCPVNEPRALVYTMGSRTRYRHCDPNLAPDRYSLHSMLGPNIPNKLSYSSYSITAQSKVGHYAYDWAKSPGPGQHDMPSVNIYLQRLPIYSLLARQPPIGKYKKSPGPGAHWPEQGFGVFENRVVIVIKPDTPSGM
ncbi:UNVERIFIED_CONTAM: hypothetical protein FKN15_035915 [Acipenser sinensis]